MPSIITHVGPGTSPQQILMIGELCQAYASKASAAKLAMFDMLISNTDANKMANEAKAAELALFKYLESTQSKEFMANVAISPKTIGSTNPGAPTPTTPTKP